MISVTAIAMAIYIPIEIIFNSFELVPYIIIELGILVLTIFFNHKQWFAFSKIYFFFACIISLMPMMYVVPEGAGNEFLLLPLALLPGLLFHNRWLDFSFFLLVVVAFYIVIDTRGLVDPIVDVTQEQIDFFRHIYIGIVFFLSFTIIFYFRTVVNEYEVINKEKNKLLEASNKEITSQKVELENQNTEIKSSINYAKRIQKAILPSDAFIKKYLKNSFILYKPKDIVAGDFYWIHALPEPNGWDINGDTILFAAADCTGHGVPGAMVSIVCHNALNQSVKEFGINEPGKILEKTRELVIDTFSESIENVQDGMDIALCSLNLKTNELNFAGANNPLWIVRKDSTEIEEIKGNKNHVGKCDLMPDFTNHKVQLEEGDNIYIFSDGYVDQFGGPKGKKFMSSKMRTLITSIAKEPMEEQKEKLRNTFNEWKGSLEQVDDVCFIGVRI